MVYCSLLIAVGLSLFAELSAQGVKEAKCDQKIIDGIRAIGKKYGNTEPAFQKADRKWTVIKTTNTQKYKNVNCLTYETKGNGQMTVTKNGVVSTVNVRENGDMLEIKGDNNLHYKIISDTKKGIYSGYACSLDGPEISKENPANIGLLCTSWANPTIVNQALKDVEEGLGQKLSKPFKC